MGLGSSAVFKQCIWEENWLPSSAPTFGIGGPNLWEKVEAKKIILKKRKRRSIRAKFDLYEVCLSYIM